MTLLLLFACTSPKPEDTAPVDTGGDTEDTSPPEDTHESVPVDTDETAETGDSAPPPIDNDGDGSPVEADCNDADPLVYPGAVDVVCDGIDADCDGVGETDAFVIGETRYDDLASAVAAAVDGDTIDVCPGIWVQNLAISTPISLTIRGASGSTEDTELNGGSAAPVLVLDAGVDLTLQDIGVADGVANWRNEDVVQTGGAIYADYARLTLTNVRFTNNTAQDAGGAVGMRVEDDATSGLVVTNCVFDDDRASDNGGAIAVLGGGDAEISITGSTFTNNRAPQEGGAIYVEGDPLTVSIDSSTFTGNSTSSGRSFGGAIATNGGDVSLTLDGCAFDTNTSGNSAAAVAMQSDISDLRVISSTFTANNATQTGGAFRVVSPAMYASFDSVTFTSNLASTQGGAVSLDGAGYAVFSSVTASDNSAGDHGGALLFDEDDGLSLEVDVSGGTFTTNRAGIGGGGAIYATGARVVCTSVDFGSDTDTNTPSDVFNCSQDFESGSSFTFDESAGQFCQ